MSEEDLPEALSKVSEDPVLSIDVGHKNLALCAFQPGADMYGKDDLVTFWTVTSTLPGIFALMDCLRDAGVVALLRRIRDVVIERQPSENGKAVSLQHYLEAYFAMSGKFVTLIDHRHKLDYAAQSPWWPGSVPDKWTYWHRKKLSVTTIRAYLDGTPQSDDMKDAFTKSQKQDDLADSLLQGMAYLHYVAPQRHPKAEAKRSKV